LFGAPNGLCSSITESKHIKAVKEPWRQSSHYKALGQMLVTNQRLDKLTASRQDFCAHGMLNGTYFDVIDDPTSVLAHVELAKTPHKCTPSGFISITENKYMKGTKRAQSIPELSTELDIPNLADLVRWFLFEQSNPKDTRDPTEVPLLEFLHYRGRISIFNSASSTFHAPSVVVHLVRCSRVRRRSIAETGRRKTAEREAEVPGGLAVPGGLWL
ncbi:hypothetical protein C8R48DRAFT_595967, partial [Suillus tomentosus]